MTPYETNAPEWMNFVYVIAPDRSNVKQLLDELRWSIRRPADLVQKHRWMIGDEILMETRFMRPDGPAHYHAFEDVCFRLLGDRVRR
jgi:hypothetical protein